jgi:serine/threonine protein kinase
MMHDGPFRPGDSCDEYAIVGPLGKGGFGTVYEAVQPFKISLKDGTKGIGRRVALKCLQLDQAVREDQVERLKKEALLLMHLQHPNIVSVIDAGTAPGGIVYFVMERLYGASLRELARLERPMSINRAVYLVGEIGDGLAYASQFRIVHRDLKPENIFVTNADEVKILDFGTARYQAFGAKTTNPLKVPGTPQYMAPEQLEGRPDVDHRADIFALGTIAYELLSGRHPFAQPELTYAEVRDRQLSAAPEPLDHVNRAVPPYVAEVVATAMMRDRDKRYQTAKAFVAALREAARRQETEVGGAVSRSGGSAPPVVIPASVALDTDQTIPDAKVVLSLFAADVAAGVESFRTIPDRVPTELLNESAPPVPTGPTGLVSDTKSTNTADRGGTHGSRGWPRRRWLVASLGFTAAMAASVAIWQRARGVATGSPSAKEDLTAAAIVGHDPIAPASSAENLGASESPSREPTAAVDAAPGPAKAPRSHAKPARPRAKPAATAPTTEFFRTMGDD